MDESHADHLQIVLPPTKKVKITRVRYPNWGKQETIILVKGYHEQLNEFTSAASKGCMTAREQKWARISSLFAKEAVARDAEQCRKRWQELSKNYKRIRDWEGTTDEPSFWSMSSSLRKERNLPGNFDREIYNCMDLFMGLKSNTQLQMYMSTKASCLSTDDDHDLPSGSIDGRSAANLTRVDSHGEPSSQEDSGALSKEQVMSTTRDQSKANQNSQADSMADPIVQAFENATRHAQEQCSTQLTEVLSEVLIKMADALKTVAENLRKQSR